MREEFTRGLFYWWRGWSWLWRSKALGVYAILPLLMAVAFFVGVLWTAVSYLRLWTGQLIAHVLPAGVAWAHVFYYPIWLTLFILTLGALIYASYVIHVLLCGPFYSLLAGRALEDLGKTSGNAWSLSPRIIVAAVLKTLIFFSLGAAILLFSFVPLVNVIGIALTLMILAFDTMDYSFDAFGMSFRSRLGYLFAHFPLWLGMSLSLALTLVVPGLTLLILPGAVVGAAMIFEVSGGSRASS